MMISIIDGFKTFCQLLGVEYYGWLAQIVGFYERVLPLYNDGLGWLLPVLGSILITGIFVSGQNVSGVRLKDKTESAV
jgi:branched-chain amino acid:cation transporter, LIVCS family